VPGVEITKKSGQLSKAKIIWLGENVLTNTAIGFGHDTTKRPNSMEV
jgi:hypothetical protein